MGQKRSAASNALREIAVRKGLIAHGMGKSLLALVLYQGHGQKRTHKGARICIQPSYNTPNHSRAFDSYMAT